MKSGDFERLLDESVEDIRFGRASVDECLARHPQFSAELRPLLSLLPVLQRGAGMKSPEPVTSRGRVRLRLYAQTHPPPRQGVRHHNLRLAGMLAGTMVGLITSASVLAQSALPGESLYTWKLMTEAAWRSVSPDPLGADLQFARRRLSELVQLDPASSDARTTLDAYTLILQRVGTEAQQYDTVRIMQALSSDRELLDSSGIPIPELASLLDEVLGRQPP